LGIAGAKFVTSQMPFLLPADSVTALNEWYTGYTGSSNALNVMLLTVSRYWMNGTHDTLVAVMH